MKSIYKLLFPNLMFGIAGDEGGGAAVIEDRGDDFNPDAVDAANQQIADNEQAEVERLAAETAAAAPEKKEGEQEAKKHTGKGIIPIEHHERILGKERAARDALAARLAQYERQTAQTVTNETIQQAETELATKEGQYNKMLADGELDKAAALMRDIRMSERAINTEVRRAEMETVRVMAVEQVRYDTVVERMEAAFPEINPDHADYDNNMAIEMRELSQAYQTTGLTPSAALQKAAKLLLEPLTRAQKIATDVNPNADTKDVEAAARALRKEVANEKGLDAAAKTPPLTAKVGKDSDKAGGGLTQDLQVMKLSQADFDKLTEETLSKNRGDTL